MKIKDLAGLSKPLCKLINTFQDSCSWVFKPSQIKRIASATSEASSIKHNSDFKKQLKLSLLEDITDAAHSIREQRQFDNISSIYAYAAQELKMIEEVDSTPIDTEWSAYFFDYAKDISDEEIQILWAKILVGEIKSSNTYFKRTLFALKHIEKQEAKWFVEICSYMINGFFIPYTLLDSDIYPYNKFQSLCDCGLFAEVQCVFSLDADATEIFGKSLSLKLPKQKPTNIELDGFAMTDAGVQISKLIQTETNRDFLEIIKEHIKNRFGTHAEIISKVHKN